MEKKFTLHKKILQCFMILFCFMNFSFLYADNDQCKPKDDPPPPVLKVDVAKLDQVLTQIKDTQGRVLWKSSPENTQALKGIFEATPSKTKLEQFFALLHLIQNNVPTQNLPMEIQAPGISNLLLNAKVFTDPNFPSQIQKVVLKTDDPKRAPVYALYFTKNEARFAVNQGKGFAAWEQGMCQIVKELIFYSGFSFRVKMNKANKNLIVEDFNKVNIYGQFGSRKVFDIDLNYLDLERVEFINGTDQGKVKARVAKREFQENKHSSLFKLVGSLIPNTSKQRIDW